MQGLVDVLLQYRVVVEEVFGTVIRVLTQGKGGSQLQKWFFSYC